MSRHRLAREQRTLAYMLRIYCRSHHGTEQQLCPACREVLEYASGRLQQCPFGANKPSCSACPNNCHAPSQRDSLRMVMRFAGPRMLWHHPVLALRHLWDSKVLPLLRRP
ncbi:nitrous oxide-stimulated promoter family protein [Syntrophotalea carbinolica]|nr:nitrous oxide-stimulated promoter family protein [Syntrophotalea carbinolica]